jgi:hypothetical protein
MQEHETEEIKRQVLQVQGTSLLRSILVLAGGFLPLLLFSLKHIGQHGT